MTSIEWTDEVWNPLVGCSRVSKGCEHCYAERVAHRGMSEHHRGLTVLAAHGPRWTGEVRLVPDALSKPLSWKKARRVFVNSMSDLFHEKVAFETIAAIFGVMAACPQHTFQVLTKRPERARRWFDWYEGTSGAGASSYAAMYEAMGRGLDVDPNDDPEWPLPNVWLGVSVEDQATAGERIPVLLALDAARHWVSYEPALGPVRFDRLESDEGDAWVNALTGRWSGNDMPWPRLDWIVVGGESGPGARPFDVAWARSTIAQCREAGVACFVKQLGSAPIECFLTEPAPIYLHLNDRKGGDMSEWLEDLRVRQWPEVSGG